MKYIFIILFTLLLSCDFDNSSKKITIFDSIRTESIDEYQFQLLKNSIVESFNIYLNKEFSSVPKEKRVFSFLNKIEKLYTLSDNNKTLYKFIKTFDFFIDEIHEIDSIGFFNPNLNNDSIIKIERWRMGLLNNFYNLNNNYKVKDSLFIFQDNNVRSNYYYMFYHSIKNDSITKEWIKSKICIVSKSSILLHLKELSNDYLNSDNCKLMIFTEFILPYYNRKTGRFHVENNMNPAEKAFLEKLKQ